MESRRLNRTQFTLYLSVICLGVFAGCDASETDTGMPTSGVMVGVDPYCDTRPQFEFCEDFDTQVLPGVFDEQRVEGGQMSINGEEASSAPQSLLVNVAPNGHAVLRHELEGGGKLRLFGMLLLPELGDGQVEIAAFSVAEYRVAFGVRADGSLWATAGGQALEADGLIPVGRWASFRWDVDLADDGTGTAKLRFGNDFIVNADTLEPPVAWENNPVISVGLSESTGSWAMRFDNLTVEAKELSP